MDPDERLTASVAPDTPAARSAREARADALAQHILQNRAALARRAPIPATLSPDVALRAAQARAVAAADVPIGSMGTAVGRVLPATARRSAGLAVANPKIWSADVKPLRGRKIDAETFLARVRRAARTREKGDVREPTIIRTAEVLVWAVKREGKGFARRTFEQLAGMVRVVKETMRKAIRFLEQRGLLDTFNVLSRDHGRVLRDANLYLIPDAEQQAEQPASDSLGQRLNRYAAAFGLRARAWGLNATAAAVGYKPTTKRPAPA